MSHSNSMAMPGSRSMSRSMNASLVNRGASDAHPKMAPQQATTNSKALAEAVERASLDFDDDGTNEGAEGHDVDHDGPPEPAAAKGEADIGLMALWGLLNMSGFTPAQVSGHLERSIPAGT